MESKEWFLMASWITGVVVWFVLTFWNLDLPGPLPLPGWAVLLVMVQNFIALIIAPILLRIPPARTKRSGLARIAVNR